MPGCGAGSPIGTPPARSKVIAISSVCPDNAVERTPRQHEARDCARLGATVAPPEACHDRHPDPPDRRDQGRDRPAAPPDPAVHRRRLPRRAGRRPVRDREPGDGPADRGGRAGRRRPTSTLAVAAARRAADDGRWSPPQPRRPQADPRPLGGPDRGQRARARDHRDARRRQADHRHGRPRHARDGRLHPLARRGDRQALRPGRAVARGHDRDDHPRAGRRRRAP